jgi:ABC-type iron transport system FetAB ATPase subunit
LLSVCGVSGLKSFGHSEPAAEIVLIIENLQSDLIGPLSLNIAAGECIALMGPSGAGKSLFLRAIADLDPNDGQVALSGEARAGMPAPVWRQKVAFVPAESGWWADRVGEHFPPGWSEPDMLIALGLSPDILGWEVDRLSSGERQRVAFARCLARKPLALLLDEPTASLDESATKQLEILLNQQRAAGTPIILVTHDPAQAERMARRTFRMVEGRFAETVAAEAAQ